MAQKQTTELIDRIAIKTKELAEALKASDVAQTATINQLQTDLTNLKNEVTKLEGNTVDKIINQNEDFSTFAELKAKISDDEFVNILLANGTKIYGSVQDSAKSTPNDPIIINGTTYVDGVTFSFGKLSITSGLTVDSNEAIHSVNIPQPKDITNTYDTRQ